MYPSSSGDSWVPLSPGDTVELSVNSSERRQYELALPQVWEQIAVTCLQFIHSKIHLVDRLLFQQKIPRKKIDFYIFNFNLPRFFAETQADPRPHFGRIFTKDESKSTQDMFGENPTNPVSKNDGLGCADRRL